MFGYIVPNKPEMKIKDYMRYREYYCGICHSLRKRQGQLSGVTLSYDMTFVGLLLSALYEPAGERKKALCPLHPFSQHLFLENPYIDYVADINVVFAYYKCIDDYRDNRSCIGYAGSRIMKKRVKRVSRLYPDKVKAICKGIRELNRIEESDCPYIDKPGGIFGNIIGEIISVYPGYLKTCGKEKNFEKNWLPTLKELGFNLGKFVYILDAFDDIEKDIAEKNYNPFLKKYDFLRERQSFEAAENETKEILAILAANVAYQFEMLPVIKEADILRNIIYSGIWTRFYSICERRHKKYEKSL